MKKKILWLVMSCVMVLSLVLVSCGEEEEEEEEEIITPPGEEEEVKPPPAEEEEVKPPPTTGNWWDFHGTPEYGGRFTFRQAMDVMNWDPYAGFTMTPHLYLESLSSMNWVIDRSVWDPEQLLSPSGIARDWEQIDGFHQLIYIREGVHWHDRDPVFGRELDAYDVSWSYNRLIAKGDGFTEGSPFLPQFIFAEIDSITAIDKWTIEVTYNKPNSFGMMCNFGLFSIQCRDVVEKYGDLQDWKNAVGTGPFTLEDYVTGASITINKNPNYWGYDERHPQNKIPYVDSVKILIIPDLSTALSALRTGKIDIIEGIPWEQALKMLDTNPYLESFMVLGQTAALRPRLDVEPFTDIRVRKAMNMAIDRKTIAETYYGGLVEGKPYGIMSPTPEFGDFYTPFEEWPQELQDEYRYDPEAAIALLAEAGYPNGFPTNVAISAAADVDMAQVFKFYLAEIGIDLEIDVMEPTVYNSYVNILMKHDQMYWSTVDAFDRKISVMGYETSPTNPSKIEDPVFNEMAASFRIDVDEAGNYTPLEKQLREGKECDMYVMSKHWAIPGIPAFTFRLWQPWLKGYTNEQLWRWPASQYARWWIDHETKTAMGY